MIPPVRPSDCSYSTDELFHQVVNRLNFKCDPLYQGVLREPVHCCKSFMVSFSRPEGDLSHALYSAAALIKQLQHRDMIDGLLYVLLKD